MPLDLGAKGSCQIGGNVATNAGGLRLVRYGSLRGTVLGIEAVLPNGKVFDNLSTLRKDNTGYDLKQLLIGSEGTLGVITKVAIQTARRPPVLNVVLLALEDYSKVLEIVKLVRRDLSDILSAIEFADKEALDLVFDHFKELKRPLETQAPFYVLLELAGFSETTDAARIEDFLNKCFETSLVSDGTMSQDMNQAAALWRLREACPEAVSKAGWAFKYDVSVPPAQMYELVQVTRERLKHLVPPAQVVGYGHLGDGNLHLNLWIPREDLNLRETLKKEIEPFVFEQVSQRKGSISAEHGLGLMKASHINFSKSPVLINLMQDIKKVFDPTGILNPYKMLPVRN